jgi:uncharacterized protein YprB with RNaseH-like and TPR domain
MDIREQLAELRKRISRIDAKYGRTGGASEAGSAGTALQRAPARTDVRPARYSVEEWLHGREVESAHGKHFETDRLWERHKRHGSVGIADLADLAHDLLDGISEGAVTCCPPSKLAFLDTETTGLAGGAGTYAFLIGVGRITEAGFQVRQFFMRDFAEETSLLSALDEHLSQFDVLVTYNGRVYDAPLLETRYRMARRKPPFERMQHVDLLFGARRLWKLRFDSCRLVELENQILGVERQGDLPGDLIPYVYFEYLKTGEALRLAPVFHHNAVDILTLACLTAIVPHAFRPAAAARLGHGAEMVGIGRWLRKEERFEDALDLFHRAIQAGLPDELLFRTMWDAALLERKLAREDAFVSILTDIAAEPNPHRAAAMAELAKYYERSEGNVAMALEMTRSALDIAPSQALERRLARLEKKMRNRKLL